ncbi:MAG: DUF4399 domain-containing protein [Oceanospirillales bacterium]|uniref:Uncharacterized protein DUF4399 n=1 Tax=Marinobacterium halophilum TaxID=267374 RepID=A0A2P8EZT9_9GAMM|nr:DUF4399 domain-containing protein [Marinobacterium halophilum]MBR9830220.1 DUF4399 domain-containing protein [Oceanospirillales bacterium]PSL14977.1 uncharacterized protein DUF4399 [Marinobacterium halophilum]
MFKTVLALGMTAIISQTAMAAETAASASAPEAKVYIISPENGATVSETFTVQFGLSGMGVAPAGTDKANTGHHHLMVDGEQAPMAGKAMGQEVMHFGGGQTETTITLTPGQHTLQLILGDMGHAPHNPPVASEVITVTVE